MVDALKELGTGSGILFANEAGDSLYKGDTDDDTIEDSKCCCMTCQECCPPDPADMIIEGFLVTITGVEDGHDECSSLSPDCGTLNTSWYVTNTNTAANNCGSGSVTPDPICFFGNPDLPFPYYEEYPVSIAAAQECWTMEDPTNPPDLIEVFRVSASCTMDGSSLACEGFSDELPQACTGVHGEIQTGGGGDNRCNFDGAEIRVVSV